MDDALSLEFFQRSFKKVHDDNRVTREAVQLLGKDIGRLSDTLVHLNRTLSGLDARISSVKDELETTIKIELGGALANHETRAGQRTSHQLVEVLNVIDEIFEDDAAKTVDQLRARARDVIKRHLVDSE